MATVNGSSGNDRLNGTSGSDQINAGDGNDTAYGGDGYDTVFGGSGNDTIYGGSDNMYDDLYGGEGDDTIYTSNGGDNYVYGGAGNDTVYGGDRADSIEGGEGDDHVFGGNGDDTILGGDGNDNIEASGGNDSVYGGYGDDTLNAGSGNDTIQGQWGNDTLYGGDGDDLFQFSDGSGDDEVYGGAGHDTMEFFGASDHTITYTSDGNGSFTNDQSDQSGSFESIEEVRTGGGNDTIDASEDDTGVSIYSGAGNDTVTGGSGNDYIDGGAGDDTLRGGGGDDTITTGSGDDTIVLDRSGGDDVITDFDIGDADEDGRYNDQIDVSNLQNGDGGPVTSADVVVTDDGFGNALLTFPEGETLVLQGVAPAQMSSQSQLQAAGIPCFTTGTMILTPNGECPIEFLRPGDLVVTRDNGPQPIRWLGMRKVDHNALRENPSLAPVLIKEGACGNDRPLIVSPQHGILTASNDGGSDQHLIRAIHLSRLNGGKVRVMRGTRKVTYVHMLFDAHQVVFSNGVASESFYPGPWGLKALTPDVQLELLQLWPDLGQAPAMDVYGATARPVAKFKELPPQQRQVQLFHLS